MNDELLEMQQTMQMMQSTMQSMKQTLESLKSKKEALETRIKDYNRIMVKYQKKYDIYFKPPNNMADMLSVLGQFSLALNLYFGLMEDNVKDNFSLFMFVMTYPEKYWEMIAKHTYYHEPEIGEIKLSTMQIQDTPIDMIIEAFGVFCEAIEDLDVPEVYLFHARGISTRAIQKLVQATDFIDLHKPLAETIDPMKVMGELLGRISSTEATEYSFDK